MGRPGLLCGMTNVQRWDAKVYVGMKSWEDQSYYNKVRCPRRNMNIDPDPGPEWDATWGDRGENNGLL